MNVGKITAFERWYPSFPFHMFTINWIDFTLENMATRFWSSEAQVDHTDNQSWVQN